MTASRSRLGDARSHQSETLRAHFEHVAQGAGADLELLRTGFALIRELFGTDSDVVALERLFLTLKEAGLANLKKRWGL